MFFYFTTAIRINYTYMKYQLQQSLTGSIGHITSFSTSCMDIRIAGVSGWAKNI